MKKYLHRLLPPQLHPGFLAKKQVDSLANSKVISGPFAGMKYIENSVGSAYMPKILGTYELELHSIIQDLCSKSFTLIIDVGAAEGYYAVGMAMRNLSTRVIAFETEPEGQALLKKMAQLNNVADRITIAGTCDVSSLQNSFNPQDKCLLIMDVEGAEKELLNPEKIPRIHNCEILLELHECVCPGVTEIIKSRFKNTHHIERIWERKRQYSDIPFNSLWKRWILPMTEEYRWIENQETGEIESRNMSWLYMQPLSTHKTA
jgi:Met-10+ like-protein